MGVGFEVVEWPFSSQALRQSDAESNNETAIATDHGTAIGSCGAAEARPGAKGVGDGVGPAAGGSGAGVIGSIARGLLQCA